MQGINIFLYGLSGAGKDTLANYLRDNYDYLKLRIAGTIKQFVFETNGFKTQEEFEQEKRNKPEVRKQHNIFGIYYDQKGIELSNRESTMNRIKSLINRTALEYEIIKSMEYYDLCIVDVRTFEEAKILLENNFFGIFLTRQNKKEFALKSHKTENGLFDKIIELPNHDNIYIIRNHENAKNDNLYNFRDEYNNQLFLTNTSNGTVNNLIELFETVFLYKVKSKIIENRNKQK